MDFYSVVKYRRSVRKFKPTPFPEDKIQRALEAAVLAPNSSNAQTWDFHWVRNTDMKKKLVAACLSQSASRSAAELVVVTANPKKWRRSHKPLIQWVRTTNVHKSVVTYYEKLVPFMYISGIFNSFALIKFLMAFFYGIFKPIMRGPFTRGAIETMSIKSAALAAENFVLAIAAEGGDTCMMEGFDEWRVQRTLKISCSDRVVMVIGIGYRDERGIWGPQFRLPISEVVHIYD